MRIAGGLAGLILIVLGIFYIWPSSQEGLEKTAQQLPPGPARTLKPEHQAKKMSSPYQRPASQKISAAILAEAEKAMQVDSDPTASEIRLNKLAAELKIEELESLRDLVIYPSRNGDLRAMAVELLARSPSVQSLPLLEEIIHSKWDQHSDMRLGDFEKALRGRAIEGMQNHPHGLASQLLKKNIAKIEDPFLRDRAQRAYLHRQGQVPPVETQDQEALKKIIN